MPVLARAGGLIYQGLALGMWVLSHDMSL